MPLAKPRVLRILASSDDAPVVSQIQTTVESLSAAIQVRVGPASDETDRTVDRVLLIWGSETGIDVAVFRETNVWDQLGIEIHTMALDEQHLLGVIPRISASVFSGTAVDESFKAWLTHTVLGLADESSDSAGGSDTLTFGDAVARYCQAVVARLSRVPMLSSPSQHDFDEVYVPLKLLAERRPPDDQLVDVAELGTLAGGERLVLLGGPGAGKSMTLDFLALVTARRSGRADPVLPLLVSAVELMQTDPTALTPYLQLLVKGTVGRGGQATSRLIFESDEFGETGLLVLIDGIDELLLEDRLRLRRLVRVYETEFPNASFVLTARQSGFDPELWSEFSPLYVQPLTDIRVQEFVQKFADFASRDQLLQMIRGSDTMRQISRVPFMLCLLTTYDGELSNGRDTRALLIRLCVRRLLERRSLGAQLAIDAEALFTVLASVAYRLYRLDSRGAHSESEVLYAIEDQIGRRGNQLGHIAGPRSPREQAAMLLEAIIDRTGLLQRVNDRIEFVHRSMWEFFVAEAMLVEPDQESVAYAASAHWEEPLRLACGLMDEPRARAVIANVWSVSPGLALRCALDSGIDATAEIEQLLERLDVSEQTSLVRDLRVHAARGGEATAQRVALDTVSMLIPSLQACEPLWEVTILLRTLTQYQAERARLLDRIYQFSEMPGRLARLELMMSCRGEAFTDVGPASFLMGATHEDRPLLEKPAHYVHLSAFSIARLLVTNEATSLFPYRIGLKDDWRSPTPGHPLIGVTWHEAAVFSAWFGCRLPTEAEWEYTCRAGGSDDLMLSDEETIKRFAWYAANAGNMTHEPGKLQPNSLGIYDMLGNVREWCHDWYSEQYYLDCLNGVQDPQGPANGNQKVLRGGCFDWNPANLVPTYRNSNLPNNVGFQNGVRLVRGLHALTEPLPGEDE